MKVFLFVVVLLGFVMIISYLLAFYNYLSDNISIKNKFLLMRLYKLRNKIDEIKKTLRYIDNFDEFEDIKKIRIEMINKLNKDMNDLIYILLKKLFPKVLIVTDYSDIPDKKIFKLISNKIYQTDEIKFIQVEKLLKYGKLFNDIIVIRDKIPVFEDKPIKVIVLDYINLYERFKSEYDWRVADFVKSNFEIYKLK